MSNSIRTIQESGAAPLPSELLRARGLSGAYPDQAREEASQLSGRGLVADAVSGSGDRADFGGAIRNGDPAARAQEEAYAALGRRARRNGGEEAALLPQAGNPPEPPVAAPPAHEPGEAGPGREEGRIGTSGGGMEARTGRRTYMGSAAETSDNEKGKPGEEKGPADASFENLSEEEQQEVRELKERDREVRSHEQAHVSAAGGLASGGASFETQRGPDGNTYAVGGEVQIDTSPANTPEATINKARQIKAAALAPAQPSGQDRQVAAQASRMEADARQEKLDETQSAVQGAPGEARQADARDNEVPGPQGAAAKEAEQYENLGKSDGSEQPESMAEAMRARQAESAYRKQEQASRQTSYGNGRLSVAV